MSSEAVFGEPETQSRVPQAPQKPVKNGSNREILRNLLNFEKLTVRSVNTRKKRSEAARNGMAATFFF